MLLRLKKGDVVCLLLINPNPDNFNRKTANTEYGVMLKTGFFESDKKLFQHLSY
jgi:hypothetical protein